MAGSQSSDGRLSEVRFLTVAEVAAVMRVSKMTVYRLVHSGELTAVRVGRSFRVPEHAVHDYLRGAFPARRQPGPAPSATYPGQVDGQIAAIRSLTRSAGASGIHGGRDGAGRAR